MMVSRSSACSDRQSYDVPTIGNTVDIGFALWRKRCDKFTIRKSKHCKYTITSEFYIYIKRQRQLDLRMSNQFLISRSHLSINVSITNEN